MWIVAFKANQSDHWRFLAAFVSGQNARDFGSGAPIATTEVSVFYWPFNGE